MKIFVSWSKEPAKEIAIQLRLFLGLVLSGVSVWVSKADIAKGKRWGAEVAAELDTASRGIICCTANNLLEPWLHFEAGAISKSIEDAFVYPICFGVSFNQLPLTLSQFQATDFQKAEILELVNEFNDASDNPLKARDLQSRFDHSWPGFEKKVIAELAKVPQSEIQENHQNGTIRYISDGLSLGEEAVLMSMALNDILLTVQYVTDFMMVKLVRARYYITELHNKGYIRDSSEFGRGPCYSLTDKGVRYAIEKGWV